MSSQKCLKPQEEEVVQSLLHCQCFLGIIEGSGQACLHFLMELSDLWRRILRGKMGHCINRGAHLCLEIWKKQLECLEVKYNLLDLSWMGILMEGCSWLRLDPFRWFHLFVPISQCFLLLYDQTCNVVLTLCFCVYINFICQFNFIWTGHRFKSRLDGEPLYVEFTCSPCFFCMCTAVSPHSTKTYMFGDSKFLLCVPCDRLETIQPLCASPKRPFEVLSHLHQHFIYTFMSFIWRFSPVVYQRGAPGDRQKSCLRRQTVFILNGALIRSKSDINYMQSIYSVFSLALYHAICCRMQNWFHSKVQTHLLAWQADPADQTWLHAAVWIRSSPGCDPGNKNCKHLIYIWLITSQYSY